MPPDHETLLRGLYAAFEARDLDTLIAALSPDVDWPNGWEGGRLHGRAAVRDYWERQWSAIDPHVEPTAFTPLPDGRLAATIAQTILSPSGDLLASETVIHTYTFDLTGLVTRMEITNAT
jgi:ketosteroid isomerase-like protein